MNTKTDVKKITYMALIIAISVVLTFLIRIPVPSTQGYFHPGDAVLVIGVIILGKKNGAIAGSIGQALADLMGGYAIFAPVTLCAKILMGILLGTAFEKYERYRSDGHKTHLVSTVIFALLALISMVAVYFLAETAIYGSPVIPLVEIPVNCLQFAFGIIVGAIAGRLLKKRKI